MKALRGPMFAPDGGGGNDDEALTRIAIKKARAAAQEQFNDLMESVGFKDAAEFKAFVKEVKAAKADAADLKPGLQMIATPPEAAKPDPKADPALDAAKVAAEAARLNELMAVKIDMAAAGVKKDDLDWAADRYLKRKNDLPPSGVAAFNVESFVTTLKTEHPTVFRDVVQPPAGPGNPPNTPPAAPPVLGNSGNGAPPAAPNGNASFNALDRKLSPAEVQARLDQVLRG